MRNSSEVTRPDERPASRSGADEKEVEMERINDAERLDELLEPFAGHTWESPLGPVSYSVGGEPRRGTVLLVAGLAMQRSDWSPELIAGLRQAGYATLAADNRDSGRTRLSGTYDGQRAHPSGEAPYSLGDMARDLRELVEHLGTGPVHVVGMSMGGMIAQHLALLAPELVRSLTSVMSTTGARGVGRPSEGSKWVFATRAPTDSVESYVDYAVRYHGALTGEHFTDVDRARQLALVSWKRGISPDGTARQLAAIGADGDRTERLGTLHVPTLVVHGDADPLIDVSGGAATAAAIPGAELFLIEQMGHSIPWQLSGLLTQRIVAHLDGAAA